METRIQRNGFSSRPTSACCTGYQVSRVWACREFSPAFFLPSLSLFFLPSLPRTADVGREDGYLLAAVSALLVPCML